MNKAERRARDGRKLFVMLLASLAVLFFTFLARPYWIEWRGEPLEGLETAAEVVDDSGAATAVAGDATTDLLEHITPLPLAAAGPPMTDLEMAILKETNRYRRLEGLEKLVPETRLGTVAREHSKDMMTRGFFAHVNPDGRNHAWRVAQNHRTLVGLSAENIISTSGPGAGKVGVAEMSSELVQRWMHSPGHKANILAPLSTHLGVGVHLTNNSVHATQVFGTAWAYLDGGVPAELSGQSAVTIAGKPAPGLPPVAQVHFFSPTAGRGFSPLESHPVQPGAQGAFSAKLQTKLKPANYQLAFSFRAPGASGGPVVWGPFVQVR